MGTWPLSRSPTSPGRGAGPPSTAINVSSARHDSSQTKDAQEIHQTAHRIERSKVYHQNVQAINRVWHGQAKTNFRFISDVIRVMIIKKNADIRIDENTNNHATVNYFTDSIKSFPAVAIVWLNISSE